MISVARISAVAGNTMREAVRHRVLYSLLFFALIMIAMGVLLSLLSYIERERILQSFGLSAIRFFGAMIAIFVGVGLIHREVDRRTIFTILSKPISRTEFLLGKYFGLLGTMWLMVAIMGVCFVVVSLMAGAPVDSGHAAALLLAAAELAVLVAIATLFSSFTTPFLAALFGVGIWAIGHLTRNLKELGEASESVGAQQVTLWVHRIIDLEAFNLVREAIHGLPIAAAQVWWPCVYAAAYAGVLLMLASLIFERRDFR